MEPRSPNIFRIVPKNKEVPAPNNSYVDIWNSRVRVQREGDDTPEARHLANEDFKRKISEYLAIAPGRYDSVHIIPRDSTGNIYVCVGDKDAPDTIYEVSNQGKVELHKGARAPSQPQLRIVVRDGKLV